MQHNKRDILFRFVRNAPRFLPLAVRSIGHYQYYNQSVIDPRPVAKWFCEIFWTTEGRGEFRVGDKTYRVGVGDVFFYLPGELHDMRMIGGPWCYRWFTLDHAEAPRWLEHFGLIKRPVNVGPCPVREFEHLKQSMHLNTAQGDRMAAHHAHAILLSILEGDSTPPVTDSPVSRCKHRMDNEFSNPVLTVEAIARDMSMHRSTLFRLFLKNYEITPSRYLHNLRIRKALALLQNRDLQIQEAAWQSGFADPNYFSRAIREATGMRPQEFRTG